MRTYWCANCEKCVDINIKVSSKCKCGYEFVNKFKPSHHINMRNTLSGTTKMEFSTTTMDESIKTMNKER